MSKVLNIYQTNFSQTHRHSYPQPHRHVLTYIHIERETQSFLERENEDDRNNTPYSSETIRRRREYKKLRILMNRSMVRSLPQLELREKTICPGCTIYKWTRAQTDEDGVEGGANQKLQPPLNRKLQLLSL